MVILMKTQEPLVKDQSEVFFCNPSNTAQKLFFYPICLGHFIYEPNYHLIRNSYDSFLLMYIMQGNCTIVTPDKCYMATRGYLVFIDCYQEHEYYSDTGWDCLWIHFDGPLAREYYNAITSALGNSFIPPRPYLIENDMNKILSIFFEIKNVKEVIISNILTNIFTELFVSMSEVYSGSTITNMIEKLTSYIHEHPDEDLNLAKLSSLANLSPYYFARIFKKETGKTPHEYVMSSRINTAKFYLKTTKLTVEEIGLSLGFPTASSFCASFKRYLHISPLKYRNCSIK